MWPNTKIEDYLNKELFSKLKKEDADIYYALYVSAKKYLCENIYSEISLGDICTRFFIGKTYHFVTGEFVIP